MRSNLLDHHASKKDQKIDDQKRFPTVVLFGTLSNDNDNDDDENENATNLHI